MFGAVALAKVNEMRDAEGPLNFSADVHHTRFWQTHFGVSSACVLDEEVLSWVRTFFMELRAALRMPQAVMLCAFVKHQHAIAPRM